MTIKRSNSFEFPIRKIKHPIANSAKSYANIVGANERVNMAVMGTNGRGAGMARNFQPVKNVEMRYVCDVEDKALAKGIAAVQKAGGNPKSEKEIHKVLADKKIDALLIMAPDHSFHFI